MRCASAMTVSAAFLSAVMRSAKLGWLSIDEFVSWLLKLDQPAAAAPARTVPSAPPPARGQGGKPSRAPAEGREATRALTPRCGGASTMKRAGLQQGPVPGIHFRTRREEGTIAEFSDGDIEWLRANPSACTVR
jgi:hypothetical protein